MDQDIHPVPVVDGEITRLLRQWSDGHDQAFHELLSVAYDRLRLMASARMRCERPDHTLQPTALVGELYLRLAGAKLAGWKDREHFYSFCARAMRWILTDHAKARSREKRQIDSLPLTEDIRWLGQREEDAFDLNRALSQLEEIDSRKARIVELRVYLSCTAEETAGILNLSKATVDRDMRLACAWLCRELRPADGAPAHGRAISEP
jgi:RNA polymerase sigma factor (TIGR02999 family)